MSTYPVPVYANGARNADSAVKSAVGLMLALFGVAQVLDGHTLLGVLACLIGVIVLTRRWIVTPLARSYIRRKHGG